MNTPGKNVLRVNLAAVAHDAGVSPMTASYAMRHSPKISAATRARVHRSAQRLGYVPSPEIGRLMHLLRSQRRPAHQSNLALLNFSRYPSAQSHPYVRAVLRGIHVRAEQLGFTVDSIDVDLNQLTPMRLTTMLRSRGIQGLLIPPLPEVTDCSALLDWKHFSVVAATNAAKQLPVNRVVPDYLHNIQVALSRLEAAGLRRLGLVSSEGLEERTLRAYCASLALAQQSGACAVIPVFHFPPAAGIKTWLARYRPQALLMDEGILEPVRHALGSRSPPLRSIVLMNHSGAKPCMGIDQHPFILGQTALELLAAQIQRGERGLPERWRVMMIPGEWVGGKA